MGKEVRITSDGSMHRFQPVWSPDSKKLLYADKSNRLFYIDVDEKKPVQIDQGKYADLTNYDWWKPTTNGPSTPKPPRTTESP